MQSTFNLQVPAWNAANAKAALTVVPDYLCPSVSDSSTNYPVVDSSGKQLALFSRANYVFNAGRIDAWGSPQLDPNTIADGPFYKNSRIRFRDITDGLSQTVFVGEQTPFHSDSTWVGIVPAAVTCPTAAVRVCRLRCRRAADQRA